MGVSTNAVVAFGFDLGEDLPEKMRELITEVSEGFDFEKVVGVDMGISEPVEDYSDATNKIYSLYWAALRKAREIFPVTIEEHCSIECPMYFLTITGTVQSAQRGFPEVVRLTEITEQQILELRNFCQRWGIEWQEPRWHLFSYWA